MAVKALDKIPTTYSKLIQFCDIKISNSNKVFVSAICFGLDTGPLSRIRVFSRWTRLSYSTRESILQTLLMIAFHIFC